MTQYIADVRTAVQEELDDDGTLYDDDRIDRAMNKSVADIDRFWPDEKMWETTIDYVISDEVWTSAAAAGTYVSLANLPIEWDSETVNNAAGSQMTRDTDYTMDYTNGRITHISGGSITNASSCTISYNKSRLALDVTDLDIIKIKEVEYPLGKSPKETVSARLETTVQGSTQKKILHLEAPVVGSQSKVTDKKHAVVSYTTPHTAPAAAAAGTYPTFMYEVMLEGTVGYSLQSRAETMRAEANASVTAAEAALTAAGTDLTAAEAAFTAAGTDLTAGETALTAAGVDLTAAETALTAAVADLTPAETALAAAVTDCTAIEAAFTAAGSDLSDAETALTAAGTDLTAAETSFTAAIATLAGVSTADTNSALDKVAVWLDNETTDNVEAHEFLHKGLDDIIDSSTTSDWLDSATEPAADKYLVDGDATIDVVNTGANVADNYRAYAEACIAAHAAKMNHAAQYSYYAANAISAAQAYVSEAAQREAMNTTTLRDCEAETAIANGLVVDGQTQVAIANSHIADANAQTAIGNGLVGDASIQVAVGNGYIADSGAQTSVANAHLRDGEAQISIANSHIADANAQVAIGNGLLRDGEAQVSIADRQFAAANLNLLLAEKYDERARVRLSNFFAILKDRTEMRSRGITASVRQPSRPA